MQKINEDENKVNLIKCPLPKIIYMSMKGLTTFTKKPEKSRSKNKNSFSSLYSPYDAVNKCR